MEKFYVTVEKCGCKTGVTIVEANSSEEAIRIVDDMVSVTN